MRIPSAFTKRIVTKYIATKLVEEKAWNDIKRKNIIQSNLQKEKNKIVEKTPNVSVIVSIHGLNPSVKI